MYQPKRGPYSNLYMPEKEAIERIRTHDHCTKAEARLQILALWKDCPVARRGIGPTPPIGSAGGATVPWPDGPPWEVLRSLVDRHWPESGTGSLHERHQSPVQTNDADSSLVANPARKTRKSNGFDYQQADTKLVAKMRELIAVGKSRSAENAARAFVKCAEGGGTPESKVKRLALRYHKKYPTQS